MQIEFTAEIERQRRLERLLNDQMAFYDHQAELNRKEHEEKFLRYLRSAPNDEFNNNQHQRHNKYRSKPNEYPPLCRPLQTLAMESHAVN